MSESIFNCLTICHSKIYITEKSLKFVDKVLWIFIDVSTGCGQIPKLILWFYCHCLILVFVYFGLVQLVIETYVSISHAMQAHQVQ